MRYRELAPPPHLRPFVRCLWILEDPAAVPGASSERVLPDGCVDLILHYGDPFVRLDRTGRREDQPGAVLAGQLEHATLLESTGSVGMIGVRFEPWGAGPFLRTSLGDLTGVIAPLDALWADEAPWLHEQLNEAADDDERVAILTSSLLRLLPPRDDIRDAVGHAVQWIVDSRGSIVVAEIAARLEWSSRRLERQFRARVGVGPKALCRIERFQWAVQQLGDGPRPSLAALALDAGYSDQAHLARDFRDLAGVSVTEYLAEQHAVSDHFVGAARRARE